MIARVQQMKRSRQQQSQGVMTQEQYEAYQAYQQQQAAAQQQAVAPPTYQQTVEARNQAIAQAILDAHNQSGSNANVPFGNKGDEQNSAQNPVARLAVGQQVQPSIQPGSTDVKDVVDLVEVWKKLDNKSTVWQLLIDDQSKVLTVSVYIDRFRKEGVKIGAPPTHYVGMVDQVVAQNPQMLERPFGELLQMLAIIDYDFDNGMDKDELARKVLGEAGYEANKKRISQMMGSK